MLVLPEAKADFCGNLHEIIETMSNKAELACVYAALVLVDDDVPVTVSINPLLHASN